MNPVFRSYPPHPWFPGWTFESQGCSASFREKHPGCFFRSMEALGRVCPDVDSPEWTLQFPIHPKSRMNMLANGFCAYLSRKKKWVAVEVLVPEPGVLWGRFSRMNPPVLHSSHPIKEEDGVLWLEGDRSHVLLTVSSSETFCLVSKEPVREEALALAEKYLETSIEDALQAEMDRRAGAMTLFQQMLHHDSLGALSVESMLKALRPPEGRLTGVWIQSPESDVPLSNLNELFITALAWRTLNPELAESLILTALKTQESSGAIPVYCSPHHVHSVLEAPKPFLIKVVEEVWGEREDLDFLAEIVQPLRRYLQWMLHHFDPKRRGLYFWQNRSEPLLPNRYSSELATADLTGMLLSEIEALNRIQKLVAPEGRIAQDWFKTEAEELQYNLKNLFWNEQDGSYSNAVMRGDVVPFKGITAFIPLLWPNLPSRQRDRVLEQIRNSGNLPDGRSLFSWKKSGGGGDDLSLLRQMLVLKTLEVADLHRIILQDYVQVSLKGFVEWHILKLNEGKGVPLHAVLGAYIVNLEQTHHYRLTAEEYSTNRFFRFLRKIRTDWFEFMVVVVTVAILFGVHILYEQYKAPPPLSELRMEMNAAYAQSEFSRAMEYARAIIYNYPDEAALAYLLQGNLLINSGKYEEAEAAFRKVRAADPDSPSAMISLGLACQLQGKMADAEANYAEFAYLFENIFPDLVFKVKEFSYLIEEGIRKPPKWKEIYSYRIMHEL